MSFKSKLLSIKQEIANTQSIDLSVLVQQRLNKTFDRYVEELERSYDNLLLKDSLRIMGELTREE